MPRRDAVAEHRHGTLVTAAGIGVASTTLSASSRLMLDALVAGQRDPGVLAEFAEGRMRAKIPALREALDAHVDAHHAAFVAQLLAHVDALDAGIATLEARVFDHAAPWRPHRATVHHPPGGSSSAPRRSSPPSAAPT